MCNSYHKWQSEILIKEKESPENSLESSSWPNPRVYWGFALPFAVKKCAIRTTDGRAKPTIKRKIMS